MDDARARARRIELLLMDVDGTLTDGTILILPGGEEVKGYHVRDGLGMLLARLAGLHTGIITGKTSPALAGRAERLMVSELHQGVIDKRAALGEIMARRGLAPEKIAFIGDDLSDLEVMRTVGLAAAVADADPEVRGRCHYVCRAAGGRGAVREFIQFILESQGRWDDVKGRAHEVRDFNRPGSRSGGT